MTSVMSRACRPRLTTLRRVARLRSMREVIWVLVGSAAAFGIVVLFAALLVQLVLGQPVDVVGSD
jgi:hypothetical protein